MKFPTKQPPFISVMANADVKAYLERVRHFERERTRLECQLPSAGHGEKILQSADRFVRVTESHLRDGSTIYLSAVGQKLDRLPPHSLNDYLLPDSDLVQSVYQFDSGVDQGEVKAEHRLLNSDGSPGASLESYIIDRSSRKIHRQRFEIELPHHPSPAKNCNPALPFEETARVEQILTTFRELGYLVLETDGTAVDQDGLKNGKIELLNHLSRAGVLKSEPLSHQVASDGVAGFLGQTDSRPNPYSHIFTHGTARAKEGGLVELDVTRLRTSVAGTQELRELLPEYPMVRFVYREERDTSIYEVHFPNSHVERVVSLAQGGFAYFSDGTVTPALVNHDLPSFRDQAAGLDGLDLQPEVRVADFSGLNQGEQIKAWAEYGLERPLEGEFALSQILETWATLGQKHAIRLSQLALKSEPERRRRQLIIQACLIILKEVDPGQVTVRELGRCARVVIDKASDFPDQEASFFRQHGISRLYSLMYYDGDQQFKTEAPSKPKAFSLEALAVLRTLD